LKDVTNVNKNADKGKTQESAIFDTFRKPATERIFPPLSVVKKGFSVEGEELTSNFNDSEASPNIILVVSMLPIEYDFISEVTEDEEDFTEELTYNQPKCYYMMDNGCVKANKLCSKDLTIKHNIISNLCSSRLKLMMLE